MSIDDLERLQNESKQLDEKLYDASYQGQIENKEIIRLERLEQKQDLIIDLLLKFEEITTDSFPITLPTFFITSNEGKFSAHYRSFYSKTWYAMIASIALSVIFVIGLLMYMFVLLVVYGTTLDNEIMPEILPIAIIIFISCALLMTMFAIKIESDNDLLDFSNTTFTDEDLNQLQHELNVFIYQECIRVEQDLKVKEYTFSQIELSESNEKLFCETCGSKLTHRNERNY